MKKIFVLSFALFLSCSLFSQTYLREVTPGQMGMDPVKLARVDQVINQCITDSIIPGAVVCVVRKNRIVYLKAYGNRSVYPKVEPMTTNTVFDLASCSKSVGTAIAMMQLLENGQFRLTDKVSMYIPGFEPYVDEDGRKTDIRIIDLLTHTSGLPAYVNPEQVEKEYGQATPENLMKWISACEREFKPTTACRYSCLNFITLQNILQNITKTRLCDYVQRNLFDRMGMTSSCYNPASTRDEKFMARVAPTELQPNGSVLRGVVHDPLARVCNKGNSGNAGVFSSADDLAVLCAALINGGEFEDHRVLGPQTVNVMTRVPDGVKEFGRSLGWDNYSDYSSNLGNLFSPYVSYGHTGYTGPSISIDPVTKTALIILTNRVHPNDTGSLVRARALIANIVAGSIEK